MRYYIVTLLIAMVLPIFSQSNEIHKFTYSIESEVFDTSRKISIYLPPAFYEDIDQKYTVTYILDGHYDPFVDTGVKILEYFSHNYKITPTIIVGVHAIQRGQEFSSKRAWEGAQGEIFMDHLSNEVIPFVENLDVLENGITKILPFRTLVGHSSGGTYVLNHLFSDHRDDFDAYVSISPGLRESFHYIFDDAKRVIERGDRLNKTLYCSTGTVGSRERIFGSGLDSLDRIFAANPPSDLNYIRETLEGKGHWTLVPESFANAMIAITRNARVDEYVLERFAEHEQLSMEEQIDSFYREKEAIYGFTELPKPRYLSNISEVIYDYINKERALELIEWGFVQYPENLDLMRIKILIHMWEKEPDAGYLAIQQAKEILTKKQNTISENKYNGYQDFLSRVKNRIDENFPED